MSDKTITTIPLPSGELLHELLVRNHIPPLCPPHDGHLEQVAAEFSRPYRERINELQTVAFERHFISLCRKCSRTFGIKDIREMESCPWCERGADRVRLAELEAENAMLRSIFVPPGSALVLIAPETASQDEMHDAAKRAGDVHDGPVIVMPYDWQSISADELRTKLDSVASRRTAPTSDHAHEIGSCSYCDKDDTNNNERKP